MTELLDVVTRTYEYQRAQPALFSGTTSGLETVQLTLEGKLPTPPIIATLGISLVEAAEGRAVVVPRKEGFQFLIGHPPAVGLKFDSLE